MESSRLLTFFKSVAAWPRNELALSQVAEKLRELVDVPLAAICCGELGVRTSIRLGNGSAIPQGIQQSEISDILKERVAQAGELPIFQSKQVKLSSDLSRFGSQLAFGNILLFSISEQSRGGDSPGSGPDRRSRQDFGW